MEKTQSDHEDQDAPEYGSDNFEEDLAEKSSEDES